MERTQQGMSRRNFMKAAGLGALGTIAAGGLAGGLGGGLVSKLLTPVPSALAATTLMALAATDGYITLPYRNTGDPALDPVFIFGFVAVDPAASVTTLATIYKGHAQHTAPTLDTLQENDININLTGLGFVQRPDIPDQHTIHWHGFDVPTPLYDGVPEVSVSVPVGQQLTYFYRPHRPGTYMYHCHWEDVEHVQMGMTGIVFVRPIQDGQAYTVSTPSGSKTFTKFAYNDGDGSTGYDRHFAILLNDVDEGQHDADRDIQFFVPTDYKPQWFTLNGRCYPQTVLLNDDPSTPVAWMATNGTTADPNHPSTSGLFTVNTTTGSHDASQPNSSLIHVNPGDRLLLRLANLGYTIDAMQLPGIPMHVVGQDASLLRNGTGASAVDTSYVTNTLFLGPGEGRDVLFDAPAYSALAPSGSDSRGNYNVYYFKNRDWRKLSNYGNPGPGGMMTEVRVYQTALPPQTVVSQTYA